MYASQLHVITKYGLAGLDDLRWPDEHATYRGIHIYTCVFGVLPGGYHND